MLARGKANHKKGCHLGASPSGKLLNRSPPTVSRSFGSSHYHGQLLFFIPYGIPLNKASQKTVVPFEDVLLLSQIYLVSVASSLIEPVG